MCVYVCLWGGDVEVIYLIFIELLVESFFCRREQRIDQRSGGFRVGVLEEEGGVGGFDVGREKCELILAEEAIVFEEGGGPQLFHGSVCIPFGIGQEEVGVVRE